jgi:predicted metal-dependent HD superfamily phosphohydrolase
MVNKIHSGVFLKQINLKIKKMIRKNHSITFLAGRYITRLFAEKLSGDLVFHNFHHTMNVVRGVKDISRNLNLSEEEKEVLLLAAWFHDSGHIVKYVGHEEESQKLAKAWLIKEHYPTEKMERVLACIAATYLPHEPTNLLEEVIRDADLYHFSLGEYCHLQFQLREELKRVFKKEFTDLSWMKDNLKFIENHHYHTEYGQAILEKRKQLNYRKCQQLVKEYQLK